MFCMECGGNNKQDHAYCIHCGVQLDEQYKTRIITTEEATAASSANVSSFYNAGLSAWQRTSAYTIKHVSSFWHAGLSIWQRTSAYSIKHVSSFWHAGLSARQKLAAITIGSEFILFMFILFLMDRKMENLPILLFLFLPLIFGTAIYLARIDNALSWIDNFQFWIVKKRESNADKDGFVRKWFFRPLFFGLDKTMQWTNEMQDPYLRAGVRTTISLYFIGAMLSLALLSIYIVVVIVATLAILWIVIKVLDGDTSVPMRKTSVVEKSRLLGKVNKYDSRGNKIGYSDDATTMFGRHYRVHYDKNGRKAGESYDDKTILGAEYQKHYDKNGRKAGESYDDKTILGAEYQKHYDKNGRKAGESYNDETIFGKKYQKHYDKDGKKTGESR